MESTDAGVREYFYLADEPRRGVLHDHISAVFSGVGDEEGRQAADVFVDHAVGAALGYFREVAQRYADGVALYAGEARIAVAGADYVAGVVDYRVVVAGVHLSFDNGNGVFDGLAGRAVRLRHASERERVLKVAAAGLFQEGASS